MSHSTSLRAWLGISLVVGTVSLPLGGVHAQSADWNRVLEAARKEGKVVLYTQTVPAVGNRLKADFEKAYPGIPVEYARVPGGTLGTKLDQERRTGADGADVVVSGGDLPWYEERVKERQIRSPSGPAAAAWPKEYAYSAGALPILALEPVVLVYNTNAISTPITGFKDLLRPELKGRIGTVDIISAVLVGWYGWLEKTQGPQFLPALAAQSPKLYAGSLPAAQAVASGELSVAAFSVATVALPLIEQGAPLKIVVTDPGFAFPHFGAVLAWAKRPNAALVLMDYLMSQRGQTVWSGRGETASPLGVPGSLDAKVMTPLDTRGYNEQVVNAYRTNWSNLFKRQYGMR